MSHVFGSIFVRLFLSVQDFKNKPGAIYAIVVILGHRLCVGMIVGTTIAPDRDASYRQVWALMLVFAALLTYLTVVRPFIVPAANFFEGLVCLMQGVAVSLNLWLLADDKTVLGLTMSEQEVANHIHRLMLCSLVFMVLRFVAVMIPSWIRPSRFCRTLF